MKWKISAASGRITTDSMFDEKITVKLKHRIAIKQ